MAIRNRRKAIEARAQRPFDQAIDFTVRGEEIDRDWNRRFRAGYEIRRKSNNARSLRAGEAHSTCMVVFAILAVQTITAENEEE